MMIEQSDWYISLSLDVACPLPQILAELHTAARTKVSLCFLRTAHPLACQLGNHLDVRTVQVQLQLVYLNCSDQTLNRERGTSRLWQSMLG